MVLKVPKIPVCVGIACCGVALVFQAIAVGGTGWVVNKKTNEETGLFRYCSGHFCFNIESSIMADWFRATQAFSILGLFAIAGSLAVGILHAVLENTRVLSLLAIGWCTASCTRTTYVFESSTVNTKTFSWRLRRSPSWYSSSSPEVWQLEFSMLFWKIHVSCLFSALLRALLPVNVLRISFQTAQCGRQQFITVIVISRSKPHFHFRFVTSQIHFCSCFFHILITVNVNVPLYIFVVSLASVCIKLFVSLVSPEYIKYARDRGGQSGPIKSNQKTKLKQVKDVYSGLLRKYIS